MPNHLPCDAQKPALEDIRLNLWNEKSEVTDNYEVALREQFKLYVESADRVSHRRGMANTFFLSLNSLAAVTVGGLWPNLSDVPTWFLVFPLVALEGLCWAWYRIVSSYGQLNAAKWRIVGVLEERLPASPWRTEWKIGLGSGEDADLYRPLVYIEKRIPVVFGLTYAGVFGAAWFL